MSSQTTPIEATDSGRPKDQHAVGFSVSLDDCGRIGRRMFFALCVSGSVVPSLHFGRLVRAREVPKLSGAVILPKMSVRLPKGIGRCLGTLRTPVSWLSSRESSRRGCSLRRSICGVQSELEVRCLR